MLSAWKDFTIVHFYDTENTLLNSLKVKVNYYVSRGNAKRFEGGHKKKEAWTTIKNITMFPEAQYLLDIYLTEYVIFSAIQYWTIFAEMWCKW